MNPYISDNISTTSLVPPVANPISQQKLRQVSPSNGGIRSRNKRLEPVKQEQVRTSAISTPEGSRAVSPIPSGNQRLNEKTTLPIKNRIDRFDDTHDESLAFDIRKKTLWDGSWASYGLNSLQEIAFSMISNTNDSDKRPVSIYKREDWFGKGKGNTKSKWGPEVGLARKEPMRAGLGFIESVGDNAKEIKRPRTLDICNETAVMMNSTGNDKPRTSLEETRQGSLEEEDYTLVYVYHVQPQDTIQGVVLKFHCRMDIFKKANRLWNGDSIQLRKKVFLPVDTCAIKGKPYSAPNVHSPIGPSCSNSVSDQENSLYDDHNIWGNGNSVKNPGTNDSADDNQSPQIHVCWVLIEPEFSVPVEVIRIPRKTLNYFPPRRRKSFTNLSVTSLPQISSDMYSLCRSSMDSRENSPPQRVSNVGQCSQINMTSSLSKQLSLCNSIEAMDRKSDRCSWLRGPGGVGTLGKNVRKPGPAKDALNSWARKRFPGIAIDSLPSTSAIGIESAHLSLNSDKIGLTINDSISKSSTPVNNNSGLVFPNVNLNGVESWMRKMAMKMQMPRESREDFIEMLDGAGSDDGRSFESSTCKSSATTYRGRPKEEGFETSVRDRGKSRKSEKKE